MKHPLGYPELVMESAPTSLHPTSVAAFSQVTASLMVVYPASLQVLAPWTVG